MFSGKKTIEEKTKKQMTAKGRNSVFQSLFADKRPLIKTAIIALIEASVAALLPLGQKLLLENPSIWTATLATGFSALQVFFLMLFFDVQATLGAAMEKDMNTKIFLQMESTSSTYLDKIKQKYGQLHSSMTNRLVTAYGSSMPTAVKDILIVVAQLVGIGIAFGFGSFLGLACLGLTIMTFLVMFAFKWSQGFSKKKKILDAKQNNHLEEYANQLEIHQSAGSSRVKYKLLEKVLNGRVTLFRSNELRRAMFIGAPRIVPSFVSMWLIYLIAVGEGRSPAELAMLAGYVSTTMMVSYSGFQIVLGIADSQGHLQHLGEILSASDVDQDNRPLGTRPQGDVVVDEIQTLSISADLRVELPNDEILYPNGLFPQDPDMTELRIQRGKFIVLVGPEGSGKTTFVNILGRHYENIQADPVQWSGTYRINETNVFDTTLSSFYRHLFYGPQSANYVDGLREKEDQNSVPGTVRDNIGLLLHPELHLDLTPEETEEWIQRAATEVGLSKKLDQEVRTLSGGERARCMIGRGVLGVILGIVHVLILDEAFAHLVDSNGVGLAKRVWELAEEYNCTLILINHKDHFNPPNATAYVFGESGQGIVEWDQVSKLRERHDSRYYQLLIAEHANHKSSLNGEQSEK
ncbi:ATP-binding cassette domain-containing protein [Shimazuella kribbensis]|uniref:ATP-binding cassette domain-containing protein n=1 Tax=Shimazuella kribbensis TaxID=139808 RepID=UPI0004179667|nr:ABC transporter ATP-binding protein [Shimazuella kribbensis]